MLKFFLKTINNDSLELENPFNICINKSLDAPADDISVTFAANNLLDEIKNSTFYNK